MAHPEIKPLDIIRALFPQEARYGDPTIPANDPHPVLVLRVILEADGSKWILGALGTGQHTLEKSGKPCEKHEIDIDAGGDTKLDEQTRFKIKKCAPIQYNEIWCPLAGLKHGRLPKAHQAAVLKMINEFVPSAKLAATPPEFRKSNPVVSRHGQPAGPATPPATQPAIAAPVAPAQAREILSLPRSRRGRATKDELAED